jgi:hypothetical protein
MNGQKTIKTCIQGTGEPAPCYLRRSPVASGFPILSFACHSLAVARKKASACLKPTTEFWIISLAQTSYGHGVPCPWGIAFHKLQRLGYSPGGTLLLRRGWDDPLIH